MTKKLLLLFILLKAQTLAAQQHPWEWAKIGIPNWSAEGSGLATDNIGNVYVTGEFQDDTMQIDNTVLTAPGPFNNLFLLKLDVTGNVVWGKKAFGLISGSVESMDMVIDSNANVYICGYFLADTLIFDQDTVFDSNTFQSDLFIVKYDSSGNVKWIKIVNSCGWDEAHSIAIDKDANIYVTGFFDCIALRLDSITLTSQFPGGTNSAFVAMLDSSGETVWARSFYETPFEDVYGKCIAADADGNSYISGLFYGDTLVMDSVILLNPVDHNFAMYLAKLNHAGHVVWARSFADSSVFGYRDIPLAADQRGHLYATGQFGNSFMAFENDTLWNQGSDNIFIAQFDTSGAEQWAKRTGYNNVDVPTDIQADAEGNVFVTGYFDNEFLVLGTDTLFNTGYFERFNIFIYKIDETGMLLSSKNAGGEYSDNKPYAIAVNKAGNVFITGSGGVPETPFGLDTLRGAMFWDLIIAKQSFLEISPWTGGICPDSSIMLSAHGAQSYSWSPSTGLSSTTDSIVIAQPDSTIIYTVVGTKDGITSGARIKVTVYGLPVADAGPDVAICFGQSINIGTGGPWTNEYTWSPPDELHNPNSASPLASPFSNTTYMLTVVDPSTGCSNTDTVNVTVYPNPPQSTITRQGTTLLSGEPGYFYQWFYNEMIIPGATSENYAASKSGRYIVVVIDSNGCFSISYEFEIKNIEQLVAEGAMLYPNPTEDLVNVSSLEVIDELKIFDSVGQCVFESTPGTADAVVDITGASGIYFLTMLSKDKLITRKILKKK